MKINVKYDQKKKRNKEIKRIKIQMKKRLNWIELNWIDHGKTHISQQTAFPREHKTFESNQNKRKKNRSQITINK